ncbi:MAG: hypothetical protein WBW14_11195, partial [Candidatus Acidiferrum sp.]
FSLNLAASTYSIASFPAFIYPPKFTTKLSSSALVCQERQRFHQNVYIDQRLLDRRLRALGLPPL